MHSRRYSAFISYRHADNTQEGRRWAEWLHRALERYVVPPDLIGTPNLRGEPIRDSLYPIFRDEDELPANADLATGIRAALEVSDHLIVLCSPRSAVSPWVRKEVREFKELGRSDRILAIIIAGEPNADDPANAREGIMRDEECFCEELRFGAERDDGTLAWTIRTEPTAADLRPAGTRAEGFVTAEAYREHLTLNSSLPADKIAAVTEEYRHRLDQALLKVIAGLLGVPLGQLIDRDAAHRAALAEKEAEHQKQIAERERALAEEAREATARAERAATRLRVIMAATAGLALVAIGLAAFGWWQTRQVTAQRDEARYNEGLGWLLRAEVAEKEGKRYPDTLLYAAKAIGFDGFGRPPNVAEPVRYIRKDRNPEAFERATKWITGRPACRPVWACAATGSPVSALAVSCTGRWIVWGQEDGRIECLDLMTRKQFTVRPGGDGKVYDMAFHPDDRSLVLALERAPANWETARSAFAAVAPGVELEWRLATAVAWSPDGERLIAGDLNGWLTMQRGNQQQPERLGGGAPRWTHLAFSPDNSFLAAKEWGTSMHVFYPHVGAERMESKNTLAHASVLAVSAKEIVAAGSGNVFTQIVGAPTTAVLANVNDPRLITELPLGHTATALAFRPDGDALAVGTADGTVQIWGFGCERLDGAPCYSVFSPTVNATLCAHRKAVEHVSYLPDRVTLVSGDDEGVVCLWAVPDNEPTVAPDLFCLVRDGFASFGADSMIAPGGGGLMSFDAPANSLPSLWPAGKANVGESFAALREWHQAGLLGIKKEDVRHGLLKEAETAAISHRWHLVDLRLHQLAGLGFVDDDTTRALRTTRAAFGQPGKPFTNADGMAMLWCPPTGPDGFLMGSPPTEMDRESGESLHRVVLTSGFWLGEHEVTQAEWSRVMDSDPSTYPGDDGTAPVENISWDETVEFCHRLCDRERSRGTLPAGWEYALPTEAQWEYACRAGSSTAYSFGDDSARLHEFGNFNDKSGNFSDKSGNFPDADTTQDDGFKYTAPVGSFKPNAWGFCDMHGNVFEWCADAIDPQKADYGRDAVTNPFCTEGIHRVNRGGSWKYTARAARSAFRDGAPPATRNSNLGFRVAIVPIR